MSSLGYHNNCEGISTLKYTNFQLHLLADPWTYGRYFLIFDLCSVVSIFFDLQLLPLTLNIFFSVSQIIKELCSFSFYSHFRHLPFNGIMKEAISSQNMNNPIGFSTWDIIYLSSSLLCVQELDRYENLVFRITIWQVLCLQHLFISYFLSLFYPLHSPPASHFKDLIFTVLI